MPRCVGACFSAKQNEWSCLVVRLPSQTKQRNCPGMSPIHAEKKRKRIARDETIREIREKHERERTPVGAMSLSEGVCYESPLGARSYYLTSM
jgi:hypothetical protein